MGYNVVAINPELLAVARPERAGVEKEENVMRKIVQSNLV
jgi:hypothetical protein